MSNNKSSSAQLFDAKQDSHDVNIEQYLTFVDRTQ